MEKRIKILSIIFAVLFVMSGGFKLAGAEMQAQNFDRWGYPVWFMYLTGVLEIVGAALIFMPKTRFWGGLLLCIIMVGALGTHVMHGEIMMALMPLVFLAGLGWITWSLRPAKVEEPRGEISHSA